MHGCWDDGMLGQTSDGSFFPIPEARWLCLRRQAPSAPRYHSTVRSTTYGECLGRCATCTCMPCHDAPASHPGLDSQFARTRLFGRLALLPGTERSLQHARNTDEPVGRSSQQHQQPTTGSYDAILPVCSSRELLRITRSSCRRERRLGERVCDAQARWLLGPLLCSRWFSYARLALAVAVPAWMPSAISTSSPELHEHELAPQHVLRAPSKLTSSTRRIASHFQQRCTFAETGGKRQQGVAVTTRTRYGYHLQRQPARHARCGWFRRATPARALRNRAVDPVSSGLRIFAPLGRLDDLSEPQPVGWRQPSGRGLDGPRRLTAGRSSGDPQHYHALLRAFVSRPRDAGTGKRAGAHQTPAARRNGGSR